MRKFKKSKKDMNPDIGKKEEKKKILSKSTIFAIIIVALMTLSGIGYMWEGSGKLRYNDFKFKVMEDSVTTNIDGTNVEFFILPQQAESINASKEAVWMVRNAKMVYLTSDYGSRFNESIARAQYSLQTSLEKEGVYALYAFTTKTEFEMPIVTCANSTTFVPVIYFTNSSETAISYENNCIIFGTESSNGFMALRDRLLYGFYGIMG